jgi:hypothetical protein
MWNNGTVEGDVNKRYLKASKRQEMTVVSTGQLPVVVRDRESLLQGEGA